jgi:hypothetical protein
VSQFEKDFPKLPFTARAISLKFHIPVRELQPIIHDKKATIQHIIKRLTE